MPAYRQPLLRIDFDHAAQEILTVGRHEMRYVKDAPLHLLQKLSQVVVVEGESTN